MAGDRSSDQVRDHYIEAMGTELGSVFFELWNECVWLHMKWTDFTELYGTSAERIELLNAAASRFFWQLQSTFWEDVLLHLTRISDAPSTSGKQNLTLRRLPDLVDEQIRTRTKELLLDVLERSQFARDWRNRRLAHSDLDLALKSEVAKPLESANRKGVSDALAAIAGLLNHVESHYCKSETLYDVALGAESVVGLLYVLRDGLDAEAARRERRKRGEFNPRDLQQRPL